MEFPTSETVSHSPPPIHATDVIAVTSSRVSGGGEAKGLFPLQPGESP